MSVSEVLARMAGGSARRPRVFVAGAALVVLASVLVLSRTRISPSFHAMLGNDFPSAAALWRIAGGYRALDEAFVVATATEGGDAKGRLAAYAARLQRAIEGDALAAGMTTRVRYRADPAATEYFREVALPAGPLYLSGPALDTFFERLTEEGMRAQMARHETLAAAPGPSAGAIGKSILRDPLRLAELIEQSALPRSVVASARDRAADSEEPSLDLSVDGASLLIRVAGARSADDFAFAAAFTDRLGALAEACEGDGVSAEIAGGYAIAATTSRAIREDSIRSAVMAIGLLLLLFLVFYRRAGAPLAIGTAAAAGIVTGFGVHALAAPTISPLTAVIAGMLAGLGVDYGIHLLSHFDAEGSAHADAADAAAAAAARVGPPLLAGCLTTVIGFLSLLWSRVAMLRDFAALGALALLGALAAALLLLPALVAWSRAGARKDPHGAMHRLAAWCVARPTTLLAVAAVGLTAAAVGAARGGWVPGLESDLSAMHPRPNRALELTDSIPERFASVGETLAVEVRAGSGEQLVARAHAVALALSSPEARGAGVAGVLGLNTLLPEPGAAGATIQRLATLDPNEVVARFDRALDASILDPAAFEGYRDMLRRMLSARSAPGLADLLAWPSIAGRVFPENEVRSGAPTSTLLAVVLDRPLRDRVTRSAAVGTVRGALAGLEGVTPTGMSVVADDLERATRRDLPRAIAGSLALVAAYLVITFRKPGDALLALTPVVLGCALTLAFMVITGQRLNAINGVALPLLIGIGVDAGVVMVWAARAAGREPLARVVAPTLHAVLAASTTTVAGFAALLFTRTPAIRSLGLVTCVGVAAGLFAAMFVVLPLLTLRANRAARGGGG